MTPEQLQEIFGTEPARIYSFIGSAPEGSDSVTHITEAFATEAGTSLVDCVVTQLSGTWLIYTRNTTVDSDMFRLVVELPLPEPEVQEVPAEPETQPEEETPNAS